MESKNISLGTSINLAYTLVVLVSYFAIFSSLKSPSFWDIFLLTLAGVAYITYGIYGFGDCVKNPIKVKIIRYFVFQIILGAGIIFVSKGAGLNVLVLLPLVGQSVFLLSGWRLYSVNLVIGITFVSLTYLSGIGWNTIWASLPAYLAGQIFILVFTDMAISEEKARKKAENLVQKLEDANQKLIEYASKVEQLTIIEERNRLAREIHDGLGHYLTTINMQVRAARALMEHNSGDPMAMLDSASDLASDALEDVRRSVGALRETGPKESLPVRIGNLIQSSKLPDLEIHFDAIGENRSLLPSIELTLFRAAQEGLNNIQKHSQAKNGWIVLDYSKDDHVHLSIKDDGIGLKKTSGGFGLLGLRERVEILGGKIEFRSGNDLGLEIIIEVPYAKYNKNSLG